MNTPDTESWDESVIRGEPNCRGCGKPKLDKTLLVCWTCFKHRKDVLAFKHFQGSLQDWVKLARCSIRL